MPRQLQAPALGRAVEIRRLELRVRRPRHRQRRRPRRRRAPVRHVRRRPAALARPAGQFEARPRRPHPAPHPHRNPIMTASLERVPCTVVTGFLGAGKTTLIRNILENAGGRRLAIIVNEFGDVGIDGEILKGCGVEACPEENVVELANGCICCTVADDFVPALDLILSRTPKRRPHPDRDVRPRSAEAAGAGLPVAVGEMPRHGRRRHCRCRWRSPRRGPRRVGHGCAGRAAQRRQFARP